MRERMDATSLKGTSCGAYLCYGKKPQRRAEAKAADIGESGQAESALIPLKLIEVQNGRIIPTSSHSPKYHACRSNLSSSVEVMGL
jgi:hypothetical protein